MSNDVVNIYTNIYKWVQEDGVDIMKETDEVIVSPPLVSISPKGVYTIRIATLDNFGKNMRRVID